MTKKIMGVYLRVAAFLAVLVALVNLMLMLMSVKGNWGHITLPLAVVAIVVIGLLVVWGLSWLSDKANTALTEAKKEDTE